MTHDLTEDDQVALGATRLIVECRCHSTAEGVGVEGSTEELLRHHINAATEIGT
jgi:hypothetical protein